ncbi:MAG: hypothetical protein AAB927_01715 [Patescibacteria group bacterium]
MAPKKVAEIPLARAVFSFRLVIVIPNATLTYGNGIERRAAALT